MNNCNSKLFIYVVEPLQLQCLISADKITVYWTPSFSRKGPIKQGPSICPSVCKISQNWLISFFLNLAWCYRLISSYVWQSWIFCKKFPSGKNDQKWSKMAQKDGLAYLRKSRHQFCLEFMVHQFSAKTAHLGKIWFSSYNQKWLSANGISVFFNCECFTNRFISDFDFQYVDRHEGKKQGSLTCFLKTILIQGNGPFWAKSCTSS